MRRIVWFSCGAASAVAAKQTLERFPDAQVVHCNTLKDEHPDNTRFIRDVEQWIQREIKTIGSAKFTSIEEVFASRRYMSGVKGAPCTVELKKKPRFAFQLPEDIHIFGMSYDETKRAKEFAEDNHDLILEWPLIDSKTTKDQCFDVLRNAGIRLPTMYELGFRNNNCIGCVKSSSPKYWNLVRQHFPKVFERRCKQSRDVGCKLIQITENKVRRRIYLDELPATCLQEVDEDLSCGPQCGIKLPETEEWV